MVGAGLPANSLVPQQTIRGQARFYQIPQFQTATNCHGLGESKRLALTGASVTLRSTERRHNNGSRASQLFYRSLDSNFAIT